jgi:rhodanese-related sulfurtransferase
VNEVDLSPEGVERLVADGAQLIDVRENYEHEAGRIEGDVHIPFDQLTKAAERLDRERPIVFYCRVGNRSGVAAEAFRSAGFDAYHLAGGLVGWVEAGRPLEPEDGEVAAH